MSSRCLFVARAPSVLTGTAGRRRILVTAAKVARAAAETAKLGTDTEQDEHPTLYPEAQRLAVSVINHIEFHLSERPDIDAPAATALPAPGASSASRRRCHRHRGKPRLRHRTARGVSAGPPLVPLLMNA